MARLFVANLSHQAHEFQYRVRDQVGGALGNVRKIPLLPGRQNQVHIDAELPVIEEIIAHKRIYGMIEASEVHKTPGFIGLCFSIDRPVPQDQMEYGADHNRGVLFDQGIKNREEAALAADQAFEQTITEAGHRGDIRGSTALKKFHVETLEDGDSPKFGEGVTVDHLMPIEGGRRRA